MKFKINVIYPHDKRFDFVVDSESVLVAIEDAFYQLQRIDRPNELLDSHLARSSMVGDIYIVSPLDDENNCRYFICEPCGFSEVTEEYKKQWEQIDRIWQCFGTKHAVRNKWIDPIPLVVSIEMFS
jgi:hypothetical protein